ncbi:O-antigen ligase family protein [Ruminiclostridium herbifermentans]|uniref:O-antigen ligase family protein n=1 Tax=Ruminiclostridium herbifermentans TaxID=2488810 RepID=A0A4U7JEE9_9FIRM|nr:O-antigen ligase family protein [Ruminiclostridium herbifermentans]QNU66809.1 O-antigen ligase family protein [Ruminiclostridium herbifermentans]
MSKHKKAVANDSFIKLIPLALILLIIPMIVYMKPITIEGITSEFYPTETVFDFFSYYKALWFKVFTVLSFFFIVFYAYNKKINFKLNYCFIPLIVYFLLSLLSSSFSEYHDIAYNGFIDRFEGFWVIACYFIVCFIAAHFITFEKDIKLLFGSLGICTFILCILGISQFFGYDFLQTSFMKHAMLPSEYESLTKSLEFAFPTKYVYLTLFNPNYVGSFCSMVLPICIIILLLSKNKYIKIFSGILSALVLITLIFCRSSTGYIGVFTSMLFVVVLLRKKILKYWIPVLVVVICCTGVLVILNYNYSGIITNELSNFLPKQADEPELVKGKYKRLTDMTLDGNKMTIYMNGTPLNVIFDNQDSTLSFLDESGKDVNLRTTDDNKDFLNFKHTQYIGLTISINGATFKISAPNTSYYVTIDNTGSFKFVNSAGKPVDIKTAESFGFEGYEKFASNRGYIWSRSIPLMKDTFLLGHGPDTYTIYFPQNDFKGKIMTFKKANTLVDKPHNMYLHMAINTGVVSLIAFLVFVVWYIVQSFRLYFRPKDSDNFYYMAGIACLLSVIGFLVCGLGNDSNINVSPIFWILIGMGIACNRLYSKTVVGEAVQQQFPQNRKK